MLALLECTISQLYYLIHFIRSICEILEVPLEKDSKFKTLTFHFTITRLKVIIGIHMIGPIE